MKNSKLTVLFSLCVLSATVVFAENDLKKTDSSDSNSAEIAKSASGWNQWRGPSRDGQVTGVKWQDDLSGALKQKWQIEMAPSYSGPLVVGDKIFVTETRNRDSEVVKCLNRKDGKEIWSKEWKGAMSVPFFAKANGDWIRSTPTYHEGRLYIAGMRDVLVCLNTADGSELWRIDFMEALGAKLPQFGCVCSPLVDGNFVYMQAGGGFAKIKRALVKSSGTLSKTAAECTAVRFLRQSSPRSLARNRSSFKLVRTCAVSMIPTERCFGRNQSKLSVA